MKSLPENVTIWDFREAFQTLLDKYTPTEEKIDISKLSDNWVLRLYDITCTKDDALREQKWMEWKKEGEKVEKQLICDSYEVLSIKEQLDNIWMYSRFYQRVWSWTKDTIFKRSRIWNKFIFWEIRKW